jgi:NAD(P)H dehydrogenase (quinone)
VRRGVEKVPGASVLYFMSEEAPTRWDQLERADAIIFDAPTDMGSVSGALKTFMDATSKAFAADAWTDKIAAFR